MNDVTYELSSAMRYNPHLSVIEVIKLALELKCGNASPYKETNNDILKALKTYNNMRQKDSVKYLTGENNDGNN